MSHPTINLNRKEWLIRHNLSPQTRTWAGVDHLIADIDLPFLIVSIVTHRVIIKIIYFFSAECTLWYEYYTVSCQLFLQADVSNGIIITRAYHLHLPVCLLNEMQASPPGVYRIHLRLAFPLYRPIEEKNLNNLSIKTFFFCCGAATQRGSWPPHSWCL